MDYNEALSMIRCLADFPTALQRHRHLTEWAVLEEIVAAPEVGFSEKEAEMLVSYWLSHITDQPYRAYSTVSNVRPINARNTQGRPIFGIGRDLDVSIRPDAWPFMPPALKPFLSLSGEHTVRVIESQDVASISRPNREFSISDRFGFVHWVDPQPRVWLETLWEIIEKAVEAIPESSDLILEGIPLLIDDPSSQTMKFLCSLPKRFKTVDLEIIPLSLLRGDVCQLDLRPSSLQPLMTEVLTQTSPNYFDTVTYDVAGWTFCYNVFGPAVFEEDDL